MHNSRTADYAERGGQEFTGRTLNGPAVNGAETSDWLRLPKRKQRLWGLSRTTWNELTAGGQVKSITLRKKYAQRGIKLIYRPSAEAYLNSLLADGSYDGAVEVQQ